MRTQKFDLARKSRDPRFDLQSHWRLDEEMSTAEPPEKRKPRSECYRALFMDVFPQLVSELTDDGLQNTEISVGIQHLKEVLEYNVPGGKCNRGLMVIGSLCHLAGDRVLTEDEERKALILGWCIEWLQAFFLVSDDVMDRSLTRRGKPCWYKQPGVGLVAVNDALWIEGTMYKILRRHFKTEPYYLNIVELFHEITYQTELGQTLDLLTAPQDCVDFTTYTMDRYEAIVKYKTAFYSFYLPVGLAMYMFGITDEKAHESAKKILLKMGEYFQIQDDYIDCYGDPSVTGKVGTDIEENKCSWLVVQALQQASPEQRKILEENYARQDPACVQRVKTLYKELNLEQVYKNYEEQSYRDLMVAIATEAGSLPQGMFVEFADRIYKRKN